MSNMYICDENSLLDFSELDKSVQELILAAIEARKNAYCPYSQFPVGSAIRTADGFVFTGCNVENGAYTAGICAERIAAAKAVSAGKRELIACAVVASQETAFTMPCGVCRQFLSEFSTGNDFHFYSAKPTNPPLRVLRSTMSELLPKCFSFYH